MPQSREHKSGSRIWLTDHNTVARPHKATTICLWLVPRIYHTCNDRTIMRLFNENRIARHVRSLHGSTGNVGSSMSAQPLLPTDSDLGE